MFAKLLIYMEHALKSTRFNQKPVPVIDQKKLQENRVHIHAQSIDILCNKCEPYFLMIGIKEVSPPGITNSLNHDLFTVFNKHTLLQPKGRSVARIRGLSIQATALEVVEGRIYWGVVNRTYIIYRCYWTSM